MPEVFRVVALDGTWHMLQEMWSLLYMIGRLTLLVGVPIRSACNPVTVRLCVHMFQHNQYLNSGPGSVAGFFVHEKHGMKPELTR